MPDLDHEAMKRYAEELAPLPLGSVRALARAYLALLATNEADKRDAERYRYVRETCYITFGGFGVKGDALDAEIDQALTTKSADEAKE